MMRAASRASEPYFDGEAVGSFSLNLHSSPLHSDPPDSAWLSEPQATVLSIDPSLSATKLSFGVDREGDRRDLERSFAALLQQADGSHVLVVAGGDGYEIESLQFTIPTSVQSGQTLPGQFEKQTCVGSYGSQEIHGSLKLSALATTIGQELQFDLRVRVSPNWSYNAVGPVSVRRESD